MSFFKIGFVKSLSLFNGIFNLYSRVIERLIPGTTAEWYNRMGSRIVMRKTGLSELFPGANASWLDVLGTGINNQTSEIKHRVGGKDIGFSFSTPNYLSRYRSDTFSTKEPETLEWIDTYAPKGGVFFDIGANVGLYSIYHAKTKQGTTYSFEPSVFNLKLLVKNINLNDCQERIKIVSNPLTSENSFADFNLQSTEEGGALSSFGVDYGHDGNKLNTQISYQTLGFSLDYLVDNKIIGSIPDTIKIDVDGIEHLILRGASKVLANEKCKSVLIEVNDAFVELADDVDDILKKAGFMLLAKKTAETINLESNFTFNQIWVKP
jgi:FkbM family methyltransferase